MRIVLEVCSNSQAVRKVLLRPGQSLTIGRSDWADVACEDDDKMSAKHFSLDADSQQCRLRDLDSSNGTSLNGTFVKEAVLCDGDRIKAGTTSFTIHIEGVADAPITGSQAGGGISGGKTANDSGNDIGVGGRIIIADRNRRVDHSVVERMFYTAGKCESGLNLYRAANLGQSDQPVNPSSLVKHFSQLYPLTAIVDFQKIGQPPPDDLVEPVPLFDSLPDEVAMHNSPLILGPDACTDIVPWIDAAWDQDALVCLLSRQEPKKLAEHLRGAVHFDAQGVSTPDDERRGILGYCWPSVLAPLLAFHSPNLVERLLEGIDAVLLEVPDAPQSWQLYSTTDFTEHLHKIGLREQPEAEESTESAADKD